MIAQQGQGHCSSKARHTTSGKAKTPQEHLYMAVDITDMQCTHTSTDNDSIILFVSLDYQDSGPLMKKGMHRCAVQSPSAVRVKHLMHLVGATRSQLLGGSQVTSKKSYSTVPGGSFPASHYMAPTLLSPKGGLESCF